MLLPLLELLFDVLDNLKIVFTIMFHLQPRDLIWPVKRNKDVYNQYLRWKYGTGKKKARHGK